jgi:hypothetical protein
LQNLQQRVKEKLQFVDQRVRAMLISATVFTWAVFALALLTAIGCGATAANPRRPFVSRFANAIACLGALALGALIVRFELLPTAAEQAERAARQQAAVAVQAAEAERANQEKVLAEKTAATPEARARRLWARADSVLVDERGERMALVIEQRSFLTAGFLREEFLHNVKRFLPGAFQQNAALAHVEAVLRAPMTDIRGHTSVDQVLRVAFTRKNAGTINWDTVEIENLPRVADVYWEHPVFSR